MSRDPLGLWGDPGQRGVEQAYCGGNPVNLADPLGLKPPVEMIDIDMIKIQEEATARAWAAGLKAGKKTGGTHLVYATGNVGKGLPFPLGAFLPCPADQLTIKSIQDDIVATILNQIRSKLKALNAKHRKSGAKGPLEVAVSFRFHSSRHAFGRDSTPGKLPRSTGPATDQLIADVQRTVDPRRVWKVDYQGLLARVARVFVDAKYPREFSQIKNVVLQSCHSKTNKRSQAVAQQFIDVFEINSVYTMGNFCALSPGKVIGGWWFPNSPKQKTADLPIYRQSVGNRSGMKVETVIYDDKVELELRDLIGNWR